MKTIFTAFAIMLAAAGCVNIEYTGKTAEVRDTAVQIAIYTDSAKIDRTYTVLGQAVARGNYQDVSRDRMIGKLRKKAASCGADAILIVEQQVLFDQARTASNPAFMTALDYDETEGSWKHIYEDMDRNFVNTSRNQTTTSVGNTNNFVRVIIADFLRYQ